MKRSLWYLAALAPAMAFMPAVAAAPAPGAPVIAILAFDNNSIGKDARDFDGIGKGVMDLLITDLASSGKVRVVDRARIQQILEEQNLVKSGAIDPSSAVKVNKLLGACYSIYGGFMRDLSGNNVLTAHSTSNETGQMDNPQKVSSKGDDVMTLIAQLSAKLQSDLKLSACGGNAAPSPSGSSAAAAPKQQSAAPASAPAGIQQFANPLDQKQADDLKKVKLDARGMLLYSRALDAIDKKDNKTARALLTQVTAKVAPNHFAPAENQLKAIGASGN